MEHARLTACIVVGAGSGERLGREVPKAFVDVAGRTLLEHAVRAVQGSGVVDFVVAVVPATYLDAGRAAAVGAHVVPGGSSRRESVAFGLARLPETVDVVLVHDAARAFAPGSLVVDVVTAVRAGHRAVVPAVAVTDTVRRVGGGVVDRAGLVVVQTPQGFDRGLLVAAHRGSSQLEATDDAALAEATGAVVHVVPGHEEAFKVTGPLDLLLAEAVQARRTAGQAQ